MALYGFGSMGVELAFKLVSCFLLTYVAFTPLIVNLPESLGSLKIKINQ